MFGITGFHRKYQILKIGVSSYDFDGFYLGYGKNNSDKIYYLRTDDNDFENENENTNHKDNENDNEIEIQMRMIMRMIRIMITRMKMIMR